MILTSIVRRRLCRVVAAVATGAAVAAATTSAAAAPTPAGAPQVGTRAQVPWSQVGSGWQVASWLPAHAGKRARATVFLIGPAGRRYAMTKVPRADAIEAWSPNRRSVLLSAGRNRGIVLDLRTGRRKQVRQPGKYLSNTFNVEFTPDGRSVLAMVYSGVGGSDARVERFDLAGRLQHAYPQRVAGAGKLDNWGSYLAASGDRVALGAHHGVVLFGPEGRVLRTLASRLSDCRVELMPWRDGIALAHCNRGALWAIPLSGAPVRRLTDSVTHADPFGYDDMWRYSAGRLGLAESSCGPDYLVRFDSTGRGHPITVPVPAKQVVGEVSYNGHHGDIVDMRYGGGCGGGPDGLLAYNAVTHTSKALLGPGANGGGSMLSVAPWQADS